jgi:predicted RNA-binding protein YlxR (DUF448 family)/ribosomal protein L30E
LRKTATPPEDDTGEESGPQRRCLVSRETFAREAMLRFVIGPEGQVVFDVAATLPGRGMWLSASADVVQTAIKRGVFARAAKAQVKTPPDLAVVIQSRLRARVADFLGLARRSGAAISGFEKAREWLVSGKAGLVVQAADGSAEEKSRFVGSRDIPVVAVLTAAELGQIFGREHAVHVVIASGRLARMIEVEAVRLAGVAGGGTSGHTARQ